MSITLMARVWKLDLGKGDEGRSRKLVLMALADHANDEGYCYPSAAYVGWKTDYSERQIQRILDDLEAQKLIKVAQQHTPTTPRVYQLTLDKAKLKPEYTRKPSGRGDIYDTPRTRGVTSSAARGDIDDDRGDIESARGDIAVAPEPSLEPLIESSAESDAAAAFERFEEEIQPEDDILDLMPPPAQYQPPPRVNPELPAPMDSKGIRLLIFELWQQAFREKAPRLDDLNAELRHYGEKCTEEQLRDAFLKMSRAGAKWPYAKKILDSQFAPVEASGRPAPPAVYPVHADVLRAFGYPAKPLNAVLKDMLVQKFITQEQADATYFANHQGTEPGTRRAPPAPARAAAPG